MNIDEIKNILPDPDIEYLSSKGYTFDVSQQGSDVHIIIQDYAFPEAYHPRQASLLIIIPAGYPNAKPDMFWTNPDIRMINGSWPKSSEVHQDFQGMNWQRWSRHLNNWRSGVDNLKTYMASVRKEINKGI